MTRQGEGSPTGRTSLRDRQPYLIIEHVALVTFVRLGPCQWFVDFGRAVFGTVELTIAAANDGGKVTVHLGEKRCTVSTCWATTVWTPTTRSHGARMSTC